MTLNDSSAVAISNCDIRAGSGARGGGDGGRGGAGGGGGGGPSVGIPLVNSSPALSDVQYTVGRGGRGGLGGGAGGSGSDDLAQQTYP